MSSEEIAHLRGRVADLEDRLDKTEGSIQTLVEDIQNLYGIKEDKKET